MEWFGEDDRDARCGKRHGFQHWLMAPLCLSDQVLRKGVWSAMNGPVSEAQFEHSGCNCIILLAKALKDGWNTRIMPHRSINVAPPKVQSSLALASLMMQNPVQQEISAIGRRRADTSIHPFASRLRSLSS